MFQPRELQVQCDWNCLDFTKDWLLVLELLVGNRMVSGARHVFLLRVLVFVQSTGRGLPGFDAGTREGRAVQRQHTAAYMEAVGSCIRGCNQKRIEISLGPIEYRGNLGRQRRNSLGRASLTKMSYGMLDQARVEAAEKEAEQATDIAGRLAPWLPLWADGDEETRSAALSALADSRSRGDAVTKVFVEAACDPLPAARCQAMMTLRGWPLTRISASVSCCTLSKSQESPGTNW